MILRAATNPLESDTRTELPANDSTSQAITPAGRRERSEYCGWTEIYAACCGALMARGLDPWFYVHTRRLG